MLSCWYLLLFGLLYYLWYHIYAFSLLFCKVYLKRDNSGSWNSGLEKEQILVHYSAHLQMPWKFTWNFLGIYKKILGERSTRGELPVRHKPGSRHPPGGGYRACGLPDGPLAPLFCYMKGFVPEKINWEIFRGFTAATWRNLSRSNLELRQDDPDGETSLPEVEIVAIVITNTPLIGGDSWPSTSSSTPSHLRLAIPIGTCKVASSVDYSL